MPKIPILKLGSFFSDPFTVTINGCKLSYILPFSCDKKLLLTESKEYLSKEKFKQFLKEKLLKSFFILEIFVFKKLRPKNSVPESQT